MSICTVVTALVVSWVGGGTASSPPPVQLTPRTTIIGRTHHEHPEHVFLYEGHPGERLALKARFVKYRDFDLDHLLDRVKLLPRLEVRLLESGDLVAASTESGHRTRLKIKLPETGVYEIRIGGWDGTVGSYKLKVAGRWSRSARQSAIAPQQFSLLFAGRPGVEVNGTLWSAPTAKDLPTPRIEGPSGLLDLTPFLSTKKTRVRLKRVTLPAFGTYKFGWDGAISKIGLRLLTRRIPRTRINLNEAPWPGRWIAVELPPGNRNELTLSEAREDGTSTWLWETDDFVKMVPIDDWWIDPLYISDVEEGGVLKLETAPSSTEWKVAPYPLPFETWWHLDVVPGVPDMFTRGGVDFVRDLAQADDAPAVGIGTSTGGKTLLTWPHATAHRRYELFRAPQGTTEPPGVAYRVVLPARPEQPEITWIDVDGERGEQYWIRAWTAQGPTFVGGPWTVAR